MDIQWWIERASTFSVDCNDTLTPVMVQQFRQTDGSCLWGVVCGSRVLTQAGTWKLDRMPGSRDDEFLECCRFPSRDAAFACYQGWKEQNPGQNPATVMVDL